jgi:hypothetical protein
MKPWAEVSLTVGNTFGEGTYFALDSLINYLLLIPLARKIFLYKCTFLLLLKETNDPNIQMFTRL